MISFKPSLRHMAKQENLEVPREVKEKVEDTLANLPENSTVAFRPRLAPRILSAAAAFVFIFVFLMPSVSQSYARAMEKIPIIGDLIKVITVRNYTYDHGDYDVDIEVPEVRNEVADAINKDVSELTEILLHEFYMELDLTGSKGFGSIHMDYEVLEDSRDWFTLKVSVMQINASSNSYYKYYHIDKSKGSIVTLQDLFVDDSFSEILKENIKEQMIRRMENSRDVYWTDSSKIGKDILSIDGKHNFYWNQNGDLVIAFDKYEVAPGFMGCPEFTISRDEISDVLKPEYRSAE